MIERRDFIKKVVLFSIFAPILIKPTWKRIEISDTCNLDREYESFISIDYFDELLAEVKKIQSQKKINEIYMNGTFSNKTRIQVENLAKTFSPCNFIQSMHKFTN